MAHYRDRFVETWIKKVLNFSPIVGIFGHRQVGKTSLAEKLSTSYYTFDNKSTLTIAQETPHEFLSSISREKNPVVIDECQLAPEIFPAIKEFVRTSKKPGQFILTGSVRFTSRKAIRESLTGRIINITIPPLGIAEMCETESPSVFESLLLKDFGHLKNKPSAKNRILSSSLDKYSHTGGLPGVCFIRDERIRYSKMESQIETIIERDLRLIYETTLPYTTLRKVLAELAANTGEPLNLSFIQRQTRVSINTLRKLISAFNAMYLIELIPANQKASQNILYFVDAGEAQYLAQGRLSPAQINSQVLFSNINSSLSSIWDSKVGPIQITNFRTRGGTNIPLTLNTTHSAIGFLPVFDGLRLDSVLAQTKSFMKLPNAKGVVLVSKENKPIKLHHANLIEIPLQTLVS